ncbi:MAG: hypothetical protein K0M40_04705 [Prolixibacteraceae bacterium]|nr:hypothetical protein [Prolixibacteraceae bacterium]
MLILLKQSIKTISALLMFMAGSTMLQAENTLSPDNRTELERKHLSIRGLNNYIQSNLSFNTFEDTVTNEKGDTIKVVTLQKEEFKIPDRLAKTQINFRINSSVSYLNFDHFTNNEAKKMFYQAWIKENELHRLSVETDSLRKAYSEAASWQREEIAKLILSAEEKSTNLSQDIPALYEKARETEDQYWQSATAVEMDAFQEKIRLFKDSILQTSEIKKAQTATVSDTIVFYQSAPQKIEDKTEVTGGIFYKIQIGAYKAKIPDSANKLIKKLSLIRNVENYVDDNGVKIFTTGNLRIYSEAVTMQNQVKQEGIKNAIIVAYLDGKRITVTEARKLNNEL